ncbi:MAG: hypothetical protein HYW57_10120 [Ignavibacteriales bacterium]|nr:hypothetical protein [Ignavibacteriales bacterium]
MRHPIFLVPLILAAILSACAPASWNRAERAYESGDMANAVRYAAQTLREKPGYEDALDLLQRILPAAYDDYSARAKRAEDAGDWDRAFGLYEDILTMSDAVSGLPPQTHPETGAIISFPTRDVSPEHKNARDNAAEMHYQTGVGLEQRGLSKDAAKAFTRTLGYVYNYKDARQRYEKNRQAALKRIAVMPFENLSGKRRYGAIGTVVADRLIIEAMRNPNNLEFMEFVTREKISELITEQRLAEEGILDPQTAAEVGRIFGIHAFVFGKISSIVTDYPPDIVTTYEDTDEVSEGKDKPKRRVRATVTVVTRRAIAKLTSNYQIIDVTRGTIVKSGSVPHTEVAEITFGKYRGDREALSHKSRQVCAVREAYPPPDDELVNRAAEGVAHDLAREISGFFR